jgi:glyoxylase-like metal-dependent hydrolase (beta-lactamase superfamily II)
MKSNPTGQFAWQLPRFGLLNAYLVQEQDGITLIDTAMSAAPQILDAAKALHLGPIRRILLTHAHGDHIGSLDALVQHTPQHVGGAVGTSPEVAISERDARLLSKPPSKSLDPGEPQCKIKGSLPGAVTRPTHFVTDGELYGSLRAIATPGHTPGHFSFLDERDGTLYAGDALVTVGGHVHLPGYGPWYFPLPGLATWHRPTAVESIRRLLTLPLATPIQRIAAGHGRIVEGGRQLLENAIAQTGR